MSAEHIDDMIDLYALGGLEPSEEAHVEMHLEECRSCSAKLADAHRVVGMLAWVPEQVTPPPELQTKVMQRVERLQREQSTTAQRGSATVGATTATAPGRGWMQRLNMWPWGGARLRLAVPLLLLLLLGGWNLRLQRQISTLSVELREQQAIAEIMQAPGARVQAMTPKDVAPRARGAIIVAPTSKDIYFVADQLPPLESGNVYQLWLYEDKERINGGVFRPDGGGSTSLVVHSPEELSYYTGCGITIEPAGGSNQPTGEYVLVSYW